MDSKGLVIHLDNPSCSRDCSAPSSTPFQCGPNGGQVVGVLLISPNPNQPCDGCKAWLLQLVVACSQERCHLQPALPGLRSLSFLWGHCISQHSMQGLHWSHVPLLPVPLLSVGCSTADSSASTLSSPGCHQLHVPPALVLLGLCCWLCVRASMLKMVQVHLWHLFWCLLSATWTWHQLMGSARKDQQSVRSTTQGTRALGQRRERTSYGLVAEGQNEATSGSWSGSKEGTKKSE